MTHREFRIKLAGEFRDGLIDWAKEKAVLATPRRTRRACAMGPGSERTVSETPPHGMPKPGKGTVLEKTKPSRVLETLYENPFKVMKWAGRRDRCLDHFPMKLANKDAVSKRARTGSTKDSNTRPHKQDECHWCRILKEREKTARGKACAQCDKLWTAAARTANKDKRTVRKRTCDNCIRVARTHFWCKACNVPLCASCFEPYHNEPMPASY